MAGKGIARQGDTGSHGGEIVTGSDTIVVNGRPLARVGDTYACPIHGNNPIISGAQSVFAEGVLVAHVGSMTACGAVITSGSPNTIVDDSQSINILPESVIMNADDEEKKEIIEIVNERGFIERTLRDMRLIYMLEGKERECRRRRYILNAEKELRGFAHGTMDVIQLKQKFSKRFPGYSNEAWEKYVANEREKLNDFNRRLDEYKRECREFLN